MNLHPFGFGRHGGEFFQPDVHMDNINGKVEMQGQFAEPTAVLEASRQHIRPHDASPFAAKRFNLRESPLTTLARKKDKDGRAFLSSDLIEAGDRLREDFELSRMGPRVGQNWERFLTRGNGAVLDRQRAVLALRKNGCKRR